MMRVFVIGLFLLFIAGCNEQKRHASFENGVSDTSNEWDIVEYNGHTYVKVRGYHSVSITHNPDCKCQKVQK